jgi:integrase
VKGQPHGRVRLYTDKQGQPLYAKTVLTFKSEVERDILDEKFNPLDYLTAERNRLRWDHYARDVYLPALRVRTQKTPGDSAWLSQSAFDDYEKYQRNYLIPLFGEYPLRDLTRKIIKDAVERAISVKTREPATETSKRKIVDCLRHMLNFAVNEEDIPPLRFEVPTVAGKKKVIIKTLSRDQQMEILDEIPEKYRPIFTWATLTGRRINEYRAMKRRDIDFSQAEYVVRGSFDKEIYKSIIKVKEKVGALFPLSESMVAVLKEALADREVGPDDYVFINPNKGKEFSHDDLTKILIRAIQRLTEKRRAEGIAIDYHVTLNEFARHSWATQRIDDGWSFEQVSAFLLNSPQVVASNYANITKGTRQKILDLHRARKKRLDQGASG